MRRVKPLIDHRKRGNAALIQMKLTIIARTSWKTKHWRQIKKLQSSEVATIHQEIN